MQDSMALISTVFVVQHSPAMATGGLTLGILQNIVYLSIMTGSCWLPG